MQPNTFRCLAPGFLPVNVSNDVFLVIDVVKHLFWRYTAVLTAFAYKATDISFSVIMDLVISQIVLFLLSATPFCWGEYAMVSCLSIPMLVQKSWNPHKVYSPPLLLLSFFNLYQLYNSTRALNFLNKLKVSDLFLRKYTQHIIEKSSMNVMKYLFPPIDSFCIGPHRSVCISSSG